MLNAKKWLPAKLNAQISSSGAYKKPNNWRKARSSSKFPGKKSQYIFHWSGFERKREYGVSLLIRKSPFIQVKNYHGPRHISASIVIKGCKVFIISAYAPMETATASAKSAFYCELNKIIKSRPQNSQLITVGDFNATAQATSSYTCFRGSTYVPSDDLKSNENGEKLLDFCRKHDLSIPNSWFDQKIPSRRNTWYSNDGKTRKCIDFMISNLQMKSWCINCRVKSSFDFDSDHRLVVATFITPIRKIDWFWPRSDNKNTKKAPKDPLKHREVKRLQDPITSEYYCSEVSKNLTKSPADMTLDRRCERIIDSLRSAPTKVLNEVPKEVRKVSWNDDPELQKLLKKREKTSRKSQGFKSLSKSIKKRIKDLRNQFYSSEADARNQFVIHRDM